MSEEVPYEQVPYEELDGLAPALDAESQAPRNDAPGKDASDIEAMLQAGFGGNVVFSEVDEGNA